MEWYRKAALQGHSDAQTRYWQLSAKKNIASEEVGWFSQIVRSISGWFSR
jgi:hypothetical protein